MQRKWRVQKRDTYKYKNQLNLDGSKMYPGFHYNQTYAPVAVWESIMILLSKVLNNHWKDMHID